MTTGRTYAGIGTLHLRVCYFLGAGITLHSKGGHIPNPPCAYQISPAWAHTTELFVGKSDAVVHCGRQTRSPAASQKASILCVSKNIMARRRNAPQRTRRRDFTLNYVTSCDAFLITYTRLVWEFRARAEGAVDEHNCSGHCCDSCYLRSAAKQHLQRRTAHACRRGRAESPTRRRP